MEAKVRPIRKVLFLCIGNSCRSQMAEAIANARFPDRRAFSAGSRPTGFVHSLAIRVLREIGIEHRGESKSVEQYRDGKFDLVVTVCNDANEECPVWLGTGKRLHQALADPAKVEGTDERRLAAFRQVRDQILQKMPRLLG